MPDDDFGAAVAMEGDVAVVGVPSFVVNGHLAVHLFRYRGTQWMHQQRLDDPNAQYSAFGRAVAISQNLITVGAADAGQGQIGAVYTYRSFGKSWFPFFTLYSGFVLLQPQLGKSVALRGDRLFRQSGV